MDKNENRMIRRWLAPLVAAAVLCSGHSATAAAEHTAATKISMQATQIEDFGANAPAGDASRSKTDVSTAGESLTNDRNDTTEVSEAPATDTEAPPTETASEGGTEVSSESSTETDSESGTEADSKNGTETDSKNGTEADSESGTEADSKNGTEMSSEADTGMPSESGTEVPSESSSESASETDSTSPVCTCDAGTHSDPWQHDFDCPLYLHFSKTAQVAEYSTLAAAFASQTNLTNGGTLSDTNILPYSLSHGFLLNSKKCARGYGSGFTYVKEGVATAKNRSKQENTYIDLYRCAILDNRYLDVRIYTWSNKGVYGVSTDTGYFGDPRLWGSNSLIGATLADNSNMQIMLEFHFYEEGTLASGAPQEVDFNGIFIFNDIDDEGEAWGAVNGAQAYYRYKGSHIKRRADGFFYSTTNSEQLPAGDSANTLWITFYAAGSAANPICFCYDTGLKVRASSINGHTRTLNYYVRYGGNSYEAQPRLVQYSGMLCGQYKILDDISEQGYDFSGWYDNENLSAGGTKVSGQIFDVTSAVPNVIHLYGELSPNCGTISVQKFSDAAKTGTVPLDAALHFGGAVYEIKDTSGAVVAALTTDNNGYAASGVLPLGTYTVQETTAPSCGAYQLDSASYSVTISASDLTPTVRSYEPPRTIPVVIEKELTNITPELMTQAIEKGYLEGFQFTLTYASNTLPAACSPQTITTDRSGRAAAELVCGDWIVTETRGKDGYRLMAPQKITVTAATAAHTVFPMKNDPVEARLQIQKLDADTGNPIRLANAVFQILDDFGKEITLSANGKKSARFTTDASGCINFDENIRGGSYTLVELTPPKGYEKAAPTPFTISTDTSSPIVLNVRELPKKGTLTIIKTDALTNQPCGAGFSFDVIAASDIVDGSGAVRTVGKTPLRAGTVVASLTTDSSGSAVASDLYLGAYEIVETAINDSGYSLNPNRFPVLLEDIQDSPAASASVQIPNQPAALLLTKLDCMTKTPLPGVVYRIKAESDNEDDRQKYTTDANGQIRLEYLKRNTVYTVQELQTLPGYRKDTQVHSFRVDSHGQVDGSGLYELTLTNQPVARMTLQKISGTDQEAVLEGAVFGIFTDKNCGQPQTSITTEANGSAVSEELDLGVYYVKETAAPQGFQLDDTVYEVSLSTPNALVPVTSEPIRNRPDHGSIRLYKFSSDGKTRLANVTFALTDSAGKVHTATTDAQGELLFSDLPLGKFSIAETKTSPGYSLLSEPITGSLPLILTQKELASKENIDTEHAYHNKEEDSYEFYELAYRITNEPLLTLPMTGSADTRLLLVLAGAALLATALVVGQRHIASRHFSSTANAR